MKNNNKYIGVLLALFLGVLAAVICVKCGMSPELAALYVKPFGTLFLNLLKLSAIPLVFVSIVLGTANIACTSKLSRIGGKAVFWYSLTTCCGALIGLGLANSFQPGLLFPREVGLDLLDGYNASVVVPARRLSTGSFEFVTTIIPENLFNAFSSNLNLLQVVVISILFGISFLGIEENKRKLVLSLFDGINDMFTEFLNLVMKFAPYGVFAIVFSLFVEIINNSNAENIYAMLYALLSYSLLTIFGLVMMLFVVYPCILKAFSNMSMKFFFKNMLQAQIMAFTTSSSSAALPIVLKSVSKMGVRDDISQFLLPLGATVNMAGTALYLSISSIFISQVLGFDPSVLDQIKIILTATVSAVGVAGLPGSSIVAMSILIGLLGLPTAAISLILIPERILDMCRTVVNVTGDAVVSVLISNSEEKKDEKKCQ